MSREELERVRWRSRAGYPTHGKAVRFHQAKADVAALLAEVDNLRRAVHVFTTSRSELAPPSLHRLQKPTGTPPDTHGGSDDERATEDPGRVRGAG